MLKCKVIVARVLTKAYMAAHPHILPLAFGLQSIYLSSYKKTNKKGEEHFSSPPPLLIVTNYSLYSS